MGSTFKRSSPLHLYRAIVISRSHAEEVAVFFEAPREERHEHVQRLLHLAWHVSAEDLTIYNLNSVHELLNEWALGFVDTGDMRLFESGCSGSGADGGDPDVTYHDPLRTLFFVSPPALKRLLTAQRMLPVAPATLPLCQPSQLGQPGQGDRRHNSGVNA